MGIAIRAVQNTSWSRKEVDVSKMHSPVTNDKKALGLSTIPGPPGARLALGFIWFLVCAYVGGQLLVMGATSHFSLISISLPFIILLWVLLFFSGRWFLGRLVDNLSSRLVANAKIEIGIKASTPPHTVPQFETRHGITSWHLHLETSNLPALPYRAQVADFQTAGVSLTLGSQTFAAPSDPDLESIPLENTAIANSLDDSILHPHGPMAPYKAQMEAPAIATQMTVIRGRRFVITANAIYLGRVVQLPKSSYCLRVGRGTTINVPIRIQPDFGTARLNSALTIGVPRQNFTPDFPVFVERAPLPQG
jgi:hypothetical protein